MAEIQRVNLRIDDDIAYICIDTPGEKVNTLSAALIEEIPRSGPPEQGRPRQFRITGTGRAFCVGQELKEHRAGLQAGEDLSGTVTHHYNPTVLALATMDKPVVAAINGAALGGGGGSQPPAGASVAPSGSTGGTAGGKVGNQTDRRQGDPGGGRRWRAPGDGTARWAVAGRVCGGRSTVGRAVGKRGARWVRCDARWVVGVRRGVGCRWWGG